jgi:hypothetical protein
METQVSNNKIVPEVADYSIIVDKNNYTPHQLGVTTTSEKMSSCIP